MAALATRKEGDGDQQALGPAKRKRKRESDEPGRDKAAKFQQEKGAKAVQMKFSLLSSLVSAW